MLKRSLFMIPLFNSSLRIRKAPQTVAPMQGVLKDAAGIPLPTTANTPEPPKPASNGDNGLSRLAKLAPSEVMTVYLAGNAIFAAQLPIFAGAMLALCFLWRWSTTHETGKPTQWMAITSATISFGLWVYATDGEFIFGEGYFTPAMAGFVALFWTILGAPMLNKGD